MKKYLISFFIVLNVFIFIRVGFSSLEFGIRPTGDESIDNTICDELIQTIETTKNLNERKYSLLSLSRFEGQAIPYFLEKFEMEMKNNQDLDLLTDISMLLTKILDRKLINILGEIIFSENSNITVYHKVEAIKSLSYFSYYSYEMAIKENPSEKISLEDMKKIIQERKADNNSLQNSMMIQVNLPSVFKRRPQYNSVGERFNKNDITKIINIFERVKKESSLNTLVDSANDGLENIEYIMKWWVGLREIVEKK